MAEEKSIDDQVPGKHRRFIRGKIPKTYGLPKELLKKVKFSEDGKHYEPHIKLDPRDEEAIERHCANLGKTEPENGNYQPLGGNPDRKKR